jgi:hypothetical protein
VEWTAALTNETDDYDANNNDNLTTPPQASTCIVGANATLHGTNNADHDADQVDSTVMMMPGGNNADNDNAKHK